MSPVGGNAGWAPRQDRFGNAASLVVSLLFYGLILILLPADAAQPDVTDIERHQNGLQGYSALATGY